MSSPNLDTIPIEIFQEIAILTTRHVLGPPAAIIPLLLTSKTLHDRLCFDNNPALWAGIFNQSFNTAALVRRYPAEMLTASRRADELRRRWICLKRIRDNSRGLVDRQTMIWGYPNAPGTYHMRHKLEDAWLAYMLFTESDGLNAAQLYWADIIGWVKSFVYYDLNQTALESQTSQTMPAHSDLRALGLHLYWFITRYHTIVDETMNGLASVNRMLRPYVFGSFHYPTFFAPWPLFNLPDLYPLPPILQEATSNGPSMADNVPRPRTVILPRLFGSKFPIALPMINHAAVLLFCSRMQKFPMGQQVVPEDVRRRMMEPQYVIPAGPATFTPPYARTKFASHCHSTTYDNDMLRLTSCHDPTIPRAPSQPRYQYVPGSLSGEWEGRFVIYGLDAHQHIMEGMPALSELERTIPTQDPQAWRFREYHHPSSLRRRPLRLRQDRILTDLSSRHLPSCMDWAPASHKRRPVPRGSPLRAHIPYPPLPIRHVQGGIEVGARGEEVFYEEFAAMDMEALFERGNALQDVVATNVDEEDADEGLEVIIEGEAIMMSQTLPGREAVMPSSKIQGTVRLWDGLITLLATPLNSKGGSWLYRGYLTANGNWIGRWRDTWNDIDREGYEGIFSMSRTR